MASYIQRRKFLATLLGGAAVAWPLAARAQQTAMPVIGFVDAGSAVASAQYAAAFRQGLNEAGYTDGRNVTVEYHWLEGRYDRLPGVIADLVSRRVAVIATPASIPASLAAKAATSTIPIAFGVGEDPVKLGLVANFARPGGNATGINFFVSEAVPKRLGLLRDLVPGAKRVAVIINPSNVATAELHPKRCRKRLVILGCKCRSSMRPAATKLMRRSQRFLASAPKHCSSRRTGSFPVGACSSPSWPRATGSPQLTRVAILSRPVD